MHAEGVVLMDITQFWQLMDRTRLASGGDAEKQGELVIEALVQMPVEEIMEYDRIFSRLDTRAYRYDLFEVGDVIYGGLGDDGWKDFRAWLIGQGQTAYEYALADPESLVDLVDVERRDQIISERLGWSAFAAYERKTGSVDMPLPELDDEPVAPGESLWEGASVEEHDRRAREKFPRAWAKFGW